MGEKKVGIQAPGPPRRDPGRNSASGPGFHVPNSRMATHLVAKRCDLASFGVPGSPLLIARYLVESQIGYIQIQIQFGIHAAGRPATPAQGCTGWARNPKGPQVTPFCHQMGRHPTIWDFKTGIRHRIPARISPWGSRGLNPNFFFVYFRSKNTQKAIFWQGSEIIGTHSNGFGAPRGSRGPKRHLGAPKGPTGAPRVPLGPLISNPPIGALGAPRGSRGPWGPLGPLGAP